LSRSLAGRALGSWKTASAKKTCQQAVFLRMKSHQVILAVGFLLQGVLAAQDFRWDPGNIKAKVRGPDKTDIGLYLQVTREGGVGDAHGRNTAKLNLPDGWKVESVKIHDAVIVMTTKAGSFHITPDNLGALWSALSGRADDELERIWMQKGGFKPVPSIP
jgi:hypothetical protein